MAILKRFKEILKKLGRILYRFKWWILGVVGIVFLLFSLLYPLDYYIEMPGGAYDIRSVLTVDNKEDDEDGSYNFQGFNGSMDYFTTAFDLKKKYVAVSQDNLIPK